MSSPTCLAPRVAVGAFLLVVAGVSGVSAAAGPAQAALPPGQNGEGSQTSQDDQDSAPGDAEQAPPDYVPPPPEPPPPPPVPYVWPKVRVSANIRLSGVLGQTSQVVPAIGWGFGLRLGASLLPVGRFNLGFIVDFAQDRFSREFSQYPGVPQELIHNTFALMPQVDLRSRWVHPWFALGLGASVAHHQSPLPDARTMMAVTEDEALVPLFRMGAGIGVSPLRWLELGVGVDLSLTFSNYLGGVTVQDGVPMPGEGTIFGPGWWSTMFYAGYCFY